MKTKHFYYFLLLTALIGCGGGSSGNSDEFNRQDEQDPEPDTLQRNFRADLKPVNPTVVKRAEGQAVVRLVGDTFQVNLGLQNVPAAIHPQHIRTGKDCPDLRADIDHNGIISLTEAEAVAGKVLIPLDNDLDNNSEERYPNGGFLKAYVYRESASRSRLLAELGPGVTYDLENRVILVLGTDDDETLPIACGELTQVTGQP